MRHLDLFSGIGGFALAASWVWGSEHEIVAFCEIDPYCQKVLKNHWPEVPIIEDVREVTVEKIVGYTENMQCDGSDDNSSISTQHQEISESGNTSRKRTLCRIDLLTGGFPCQPFSCAGKRAGKEDNRFLWPEMLRVIAEVRPRFILAENVPGIIKMELDNCLSALEAEGYTCGTLIIPACAVDAPHRRDRVWIVAWDSKGNTSGKIGRILQGENAIPRRICEDVADSKRVLPQGFNNGQGKVKSGGSSWWSVEPNVGRVANGIPNRVDRLRALGNAIVPQVAAEIMKAIKQAMEH